jgi:hypothetical protein
VNKQDIASLDDASTGRPSSAGCDACGRSAARNSPCNTSMATRAMAMAAPMLSTRLIKTAPTALFLLTPNARKAPTALTSSTPISTGSGKINEKARLKKYTASACHSDTAPMPRPCTTT